MVVVVLWNCYWCGLLDEFLCDEVVLKNILMIGFIGVGKIEIVCCLVKFVGVFFIKVEVIKFMEVGYVGCDVELMVCDLVEMLVWFVKEEKMNGVCDCVEENVNKWIVEFFVLSKKK